MHFWFFFCIVSLHSFFSYVYHPKKFTWVSWGHKGESRGRRVRIWPVLWLFFWTAKGIFSRQRNRNLAIRVHNHVCFELKLSTSENSELLKKFNSTIFVWCCSYWNSPQHWDVYLHYWSGEILGYMIFGSKYCILGQ